MEWGGENNGGLYINSSQTHLAGLAATMVHRLAFSFVRGHCSESQNASEKEKDGWRGDHEAATFVLIPTVDKDAHKIRVSPNWPCAKSAESSRVRRSLISPSVVYTRFGRLSYTKSGHSFKQKKKTSNLLSVGI